MQASLTPSPIDQLLALGEDKARGPWPDYLALGLNEEHIPELTRLALEWETKLDDDAYDQPAAWAPIHAWRALGQLRAMSATDALLALLDRTDNEGDDWASEELPRVFGLFGAACIPALATYLADTKHGLWARCAAVSGLEEVAEGDDQSRSIIVETVTRQLERFAEQDPVLNACLIHLLVTWKALASAPLIERAYAAGQVDLMYRGDWEDAQVDLGLKDKRDTPYEGFWAPDAPRASRSFSGESAIPSLPFGARSAIRSTKTKGKSRRKQAKKSRQKNRRKK
ncbi:MAG: hypothetical protein HZB53_12905 [Chloroflexi bacterium]|nr:hypothetical protein [Chloroflexota bacterium]